MDGQREFKIYITTRLWILELRYRLSRALWLQFIFFGGLVWRHDLQLITSIQPHRPQEHQQEDHSMPAISP